MSKHKIEDCTSVLYNIAFVDPKKDDKCYSLMCRDGKCICMDREQSGLLRKILSEEDQMAMEYAGERFFFQNLQSQLFQEGVCKQSLASQDTYYETLFYNRFLLPEDEEKLCEIIEAYRFLNRNLMDVIKSIPTIHMVNATLDIKERNSLIYLCIYSPYAERYMSILFRAIICRTIGCCQKGETQEEKEQYVCELAKLFEQLAELYDKDTQEIINTIAKCVERYIDGWKKIESGQCGAEVRNILNELQVYSRELENAATRHMAEEEGRYSKLYCILKKILETADISVKGLPDLPFADFEDEKTDYDKVVNILDIVKNDEAKRKEIWSILSRIFWGGEDIPTDEIEEMEQIAGIV